MEEKKYNRKKQSEYITKTAYEAMKANKDAKQSKKDRIKEILKEAGYDPKAQYTSKQKRKFTRIVKNKLFTESKPVTLTKDEILSRFEEEKKLKAFRFDRLHYEPLPVKKGKQRLISVAELLKKEEPKERKFMYVVQRKRSDDPMRTYDFATDYFNADTREAAKKKVMKIAKKYKKDESFAGITVKDINGDNSHTYYSGKRLLEVKKAA